MGWIDIRCQQLIIGGILAQLQSPPGAVHLHATDFEHRVAGRLYADILRVQAAQPAWTLVQVAADCAGRFEQAGVTAQLLEELAADAAGLPAAALAAAYRRVLRFGCANAIEHETAVIARPLSDAGDMQDCAHAYARLGLALTRRAQVAALPAVGSITSFELFGVWHDQRPATRCPQDPDRDRVRAEEHILAGLIQYPDIAWVITGWLPAQVFTSRPRRSIYRALTEDVLPSPQDTALRDLRKGLQELHTVKCLHDSDRLAEEALLTRLVKAPTTAGEALRAANTVYSTDWQAARTPTEPTDTP